jgi:hypothetical protein
VGGELLVFLVEEAVVRLELLNHVVLWSLRRRVVDWMVYLRRPYSSIGDVNCIDHRFEIVDGIDT